MSIIHLKASTVGDGPNPAKVQPSDWNADHVITSVVLAAMTPGGTTGVYAGAQTLVRIFQAAVGAGGQSAGLNVFVGGAGNSTMTNGAGGTHLASYNTAVGVSSLQSNQTGYSNSAFGAYSQQFNTTGYSNSAVGTNSLYANQTGSSNSAVGAYSLNANTTGYSNTAVGVSSLQSNTTGFYNAAFGVDAGRFQADGATALIDPENSVYIGAWSRGFNNSDSNSIVIGYLAIGAGANKAVIGNASVTDVYLGSAAGLAILHAATLTLTAGAVTYAANDSGGTGYRMVKVPNA
jgi:hypothetical protein